MNSELSRRAVIGSAMAAAVATLPLPALALTDAEAEALVNKVVGEINKVIASGKPLNSMIKDFERIFSRYADVNIIARSALGPASKTASKSQMRNFTKAFQGYIARKYGKRFNEFVGGRIEVKGTRKVKSWQEVKSLVYLRGSAPFNVNFLVSDRSGKDLFFDMVIEGISLRLTERTEIGSLLDKNKGNINKMIADLKKAG